MRLLLKRDFGEKRARICANENCRTPYFVATRGDKKFCGRRCAKAVTQRNFQNRWRKR
jgi:hypothetical protein